MSRLTTLAVAGLSDGCAQTTVKAPLCSEVHQ